MLPDDVRVLALMLPQVLEGAHMGNPDFRIGGRIFATLWTEEDRVVLRLPPDLQAELIEAEPDVFEAIPGSWGRRGWTNLDLNGTEDEELLRAALLAAWRHAAPAEIVAELEPFEEVRDR